MKICLGIVLLCLCLAVSVESAGRSQTFFVKPGTKDSIRMGKMIVNVTNDEIGGCGTYEIVDATTHQVKGVGPVSEKFRTTLSFAEFNGGTVSFACEFMPHRPKGLGVPTVTVTY